jgi:hypothetical protein
MGKRDLIELIKSFDGNNDVQVDVYFKNGDKKSLSSMSISGNLFVSSGKEIPFSQITHAEIYSA